MRRECVQVLERRDSGTHYSLQARAFAKGSELRKLSTGWARVEYAPSARGGTRGVRVEHRYILKDIDRSFPAHAAFASLAPPSLIPSLWRVRPSLPGSVPSVPNPPRRLQVLSLPAPPSRSHASPLCPCRCHRSLRSNAQLGGFVGLLPVSCGRRRVY